MDLSTIDPKLVALVVGLALPHIAALLPPKWRGKLGLVGKALSAFAGNYRHAANAVHSDGTADRRAIAAAADSGQLPVVRPVSCEHCGRRLRGSGGRPDSEVGAPPHHGRRVALAGELRPACNWRCEPCDALYPAGPADCPGCGAATVPCGVVVAAADLDQ